jgi:hypothetical protein
MDGWASEFYLFFFFPPLFFPSFALLLATQQTAVLMPSTFDQVLYRIGFKLLSATINEERSFGLALAGVYRGFPSFRGVRRFRAGSATSSMWMSLRGIQ